MPIKIIELGLPGLLLIEPARFSDARGFFSETYNSHDLVLAGFKTTFVQDNHSFSVARGTVRGLHFQAPPHDQDKLVRVTRGSIMDVAIDIRQGSPTFGQHRAEILSAENWRQLLVPKGFAHGFCTLEPDTEVIYKVTQAYNKESDGGILWNDPSLTLPWPDFAGSVLSEKDRQLPCLDQFENRFRYEW